MINRRHFVVHGATGAACLGAGAQALAAPQDRAGEGAGTRFANALWRGLTPDQRAQAHARVHAAGWDRQGPPALGTLKAAIADDFRAGASCRVNGIRFSQTEIAWCVALVETRGLA